MLLALALAASAAAPGEILRDLEHLRVVGSVLYVAAHPDDENTGLLAWLDGERGLRATYLSMTRGGGGQNLIGPEQAEMLGVVRTGELLAARGIDGAEQRFTRMVDFGYSKSAEETLALWGPDALDDVVRAIREVRPDIIVTRFPTEGETHGHHLASARLAKEAFTLAADPAYATPGLDPWAADRLVHNVSSWNIDPETDTSAWAKVDVGTWDPRTGRSYGEVAAGSRTMHKSQGFGSAPDVGPDVEYFASVLGTPVAPGADPFGGLDRGWSQVDGGKAVDKALVRAILAFEAADPAASLPALAKVHAALRGVGDTAALELIMADCAGLWLTARAANASVAPGGTVPVTVTAVPRGVADVVLHTVTLSTGATAPLAVKVELQADIPANAPVTRPHWLVEPGSRNQNTIVDPALRNTPDLPASVLAYFDVTIAGVRMTLERPVAFASTDPVAGERIQALEILPAVTVTFAEPARILVSGATTTRLVIRADAGAAGAVELTAPPGVVATPAAIPYDLAPGAEISVDVQLSGSGSGPLVATVGDQLALQRAVVDYPHLPRRTVLTPAVQQLVPVDLARGPTTRVGYVVGSGDAVPDALRAAGYVVEILDDAALSGELSRFDAIVTGVRAHNTRPHLLDVHDRLMAYVERGGRLIVQYNTNNRLDPLTASIGPKPLTIGRGRVTDETAALVPVRADHPALTGPNRIGPADLDGWVQERGLYFASAWDPAYEALFTAADPGEEPLAGGTLIAHHGDGVFVYTGLAFFRQLPAGVPGAYRLLANLLALE